MAWRAQRFPSSPSRSPFSARRMSSLIGIGGMTRSPASPSRNRRVARQAIPGAARAEGLHSPRAGQGTGHRTGYPGRPDSAARSPVQVLTTNRRAAFMVCLDVRRVSVRLTSGRGNALTPPAQLTPPPAPPKSPPERPTFDLAFAREEGFIQPLLNRSRCHERTLELDRRRPGGGLAHPAHEPRKSSCPPCQPANVLK